MNTVIGHYLTDEGDGFELRLVNDIFGVATFKNYILNSSDFRLKSLELFINPTSSELYLIFENMVVLEIGIFNLNGQILKTIDSNYNIIDISELPTGIYFLNIMTDSGLLTRKFLKK